jgi:predicted aconitase
VADTCAVVSPLERMGFETVGVDSAKAAHYLPGLCGVKVVFSTPERLLEGILG